MTRDTSRDIWRESREDGVAFGADVELLLLESYAAVQVCRVDVNWLLLAALPLSFTGLLFQELVL